MLLIGIAGGTGSGKTTVVKKLTQIIPEEYVGVILQDDYYKDTSHLSFEERTKINFDHPSAIDFNLLITQLKQLKNNNPINQPIYSFTEHNRTKNTRITTPKKIIILEGILIFTNPKLRNLLDLKIYIEAEDDIRLIRRLKRDVAERGRNTEEVIKRYENTLKPMHLKYIEPSKAYADLIIPYNTENNKAINILKAIINQELR